MDDILPLGYEGKDNNEQFRTDCVSNQVLQEMCFHESAHLVLSRYYYLRGLTDKVPISVRVSRVENASEILFERTSNAADDHDYYRKDLNRVEAYIIQLLSGYVSYLIFVDDVEDWVGHLDGGINTYYPLSHAANQMNISDFRKVKPIITDFFPDDDGDYMSNLLTFVNKTQHLFADSDIQNAINYCAQYLWGRLGELIQHDELNSMVEKIDQILSKSY